MAIHELPFLVRQAGGRVLPIVSALLLGAVASAAAQHLPPSDPLAGELRVMLAADSTWHPARVVMLDGCPAIALADAAEPTDDRRLLRRFDRFAAVERRPSSRALWERVPHATLRELESCPSGGRRG